MWTKQFFADLIERSLKAAAWSAIATLGADATGTITGVDWLAVLNVAGFAFVTSVLLNLVGTKALRLGAKDSASFLPADLDPPKRRDRGASEVGLLFVAIVVVFAIWLGLAVHPLWFLLLLFVLLALAL